MKKGEIVRMSEENLTSQDKEELKRRLELLQREYERTAQRLQRAEWREAVRKNVQNTITEQNRLLHINTSAMLEQSSSSSPEPLSNPNVPSDTTKVRFHLPDSSPFSTLTRKQSPSRTHRLRSKRSRLRLQGRGRESDTEESQEKTGEGTEERWREEPGEMESECERTGEEKEKDVERGRKEEEKKEENREKTETLKDGLKKNEDNSTPSSILQSAAENSSVDQSHLTKLLEVNDPPADQSALRNSPSASYRSDSSDRPNPSSEARSPSCSGIANDAEKSPGSADFLTSCTLIEGLPFPVEYYVRTTRRMASARASVDLNAVLQSQLSNGRGRRRSSRGRVTSRPSSEKPPERSGCRKRGPRGRRGRGRARETNSSGQSESLLRSPSSFPQEESEPIPSPKPSSDPAPDPQLHLSRELSADSRAYPIFRKRRGRAGVSRSQIPASVHDSSHLLPSLTSLTQALRRTKDFPNRGGLRSVSDMQDFHLPDDEFGQLKLERLRSSSNAELLAHGACCRKNGSVNVSEGGQVENENVVLDPLQHGACLESSLPLMFTEPRRAETGNADQSEREIASQTLDNPQESDDLLRTSFATRAEVHHDRGDEKHTQQIEPNDPHTLAARRSFMLNLSVSSTSHTQTDHNTSLISLGATPNVFIASPSSELTPFLLSSDQDVASGQSQAEGNKGTPENENVSGSPKVQIQGCDVCEHSYSRSHSSDRSTTNHVLISAEVELQGSNVSDEKGVTQVKSSTRENNAEVPKLTNQVLMCSETQSQHHITYALSHNNPLLSKNCHPLSQNSPPLSQNSPPLSQNGHPLSQNGPPRSQNGPPLSDNNPLLSQNGPPRSQNDPPLSQNGPPLSKNDLPLSQNDPPLSQNDPPLSQNDPRLSQNDPRLSQNDPRLSQNDLPLSQNDPPLSQNDPRLSQNDPRLSQNDLHLSQNDPPLSQNDPRLSQNDPALSQNDPPLSQNCPPLSQNDLFFPQNSPPLSQNDPPLSQNDPPCAQNGPPLSQNGPPLSQNDPLLSQNDPPLSQNDPPLSQNCPPLSQNGPPLSKNDPPLSQNDPPLSQNGPPLSQNGPPLSQNDPPLSKNGLPLSQNDLFSSQNDPPLSQNGPPLSKNDPPLSQNGPPLSKNGPPLSQNDPPLSQNDPPLSQNEPAQKTRTPDSDEPYTISELDFHSRTPVRETSPRVEENNMLNSQTSALPVVSANQREDSDATLSFSLVKPSQTHTRGSPSQHVELPSCGSLRRTHTLKALDGGCVLDVCLVRWPSDDWCVCVAGEWSVCVWKQKAGVQQWSLLYTWTFTQSVISLQGIPDSSALLCVCLGRLEITETRILSCPSTDGEFSQAELYKGLPLQAVLAVSERRVACCSASGAQQNVQVFTLTQDGRIAETLPLVSTYQSIQTLVAVERQKDALIGWTEHKSLLIWNMKSGQLLQTIHLAPESVSTATCLRGYSYRGALCVLLQQASACHDEAGSTLFTLFATNPLTGEYLSLRSIATPPAPTERLIDSDVCESALVGVFQSGLAIWNLAGGVACTYVSEPAGVCRLARWAGPNTLLTGYLNGDVNIYQRTERS